MSAAAVLVIVIAAGEAHAPVTQALLATAAAALPANATLRVALVPDPSEADLVQIERALGAGAVVAVSWRAAPPGARASLRLHEARGDRWTVRAIDFTAHDGATERGRTLGFAIASMWPEHVTTDVAAAEQPLPPTARATAAEPKPPASLEPVTPNTIAPLPPQAPMAAGIGAIGSTGLGGTAAGVGGGAELVWRRFASLWLRAALALRVGAMPDLPGEDWLASVALGGEWWPHALAVGRRWRFGVRVDLLGLGHVVHRTASVSSPDPPQPGAAGQPTAAETQLRLLPGVDAAVRTALRLSPRLDFTFGLGLELAAGRTELRVGEDRMVRATLAPARGVADLGLRLSF